VLREVESTGEELRRRRTLLPSPSPTRFAPLTSCASTAVGAFGGIQSSWTNGAARGMLYPTGTMSVLDRALGGEPRKTHPLSPYQMERGSVDEGYWSDVPGAAVEGDADKRKCD
jgi:hypothetical protein